MNWRRGLLRLWIAASVLWVVFAAFTFRPDRFASNLVASYRTELPEVPAGVENRFARLQVEQQREAVMNARERMRDRALSNLGAFAFIAAAVPLLALAGGFLVSWIGRGFRDP